MARDTVGLTIERMGMNGEGVAKLPDGRLAFVQNGLPGETVEIRVLEEHKNFVRAVATKTHVASIHRQTPVCPVYSACGGCALQHWDYRQEMAYKEERVRQALIRLGGISDPPVDSIRAPAYPYGYRNKGLFPWGGTADHPILGLYRRGTHEVIAVSECGIQDPLVNEVVAKAPEIAKRYGLAPYQEKTGQGVLRHLLVRSSKDADKSLALLVVAREAAEIQKMAEDLLQACPHLAGVGMNLNPNPGNRALGAVTRPLAGEAFLMERILGMRFKMSFTSFFQINPRQVEVLYQLAIDGLGEQVGEVWDLYAGVGTLAALASRKADTVKALEMDPAAVMDARENFALNHLTGATVEAGAAEVLLPQWIDRGLGPPQAVIVDPPRTGLRPQVIESLTQLKVPRIVYVSCNPDTLARDIARWRGKYHLNRVTPVDMFPRTDHVESCAVLDWRPEA